MRPFSHNFFAFDLIVILILRHSYGEPFLIHTYLHHLSRSDHRHNFSPYNILLYISSSPNVELKSPYPSLAFIPQLFIAGVLLPFMLAKKDLAKTMFVQTFAFVTFNKVCTSQYFMWYIVLLPFYLPSSKMLKNKTLGILAVLLWTLAQVSVALFFFYEIVC